MLPLIISILFAVIFAVTMVLLALKKRRTVVNDMDAIVCQEKTIQHCEKSRTKDEESDEPHNDDSSFSGEYDDKQNLLDYLAAMQSVESFKNRYSALQNATYVAQRIIDDYNASESKDGFYDYVVSYCKKMEFQDSDKLYQISEDVAHSLKSGKSPKKASNDAIRQRGLSRPKPEAIYPLHPTGDDEIDEFIELAKVLLHKRVGHVKTTEQEGNDEVKRIVDLYQPREGQSFYDYFTKAYQFDYLIEKRYQELYFLLKQIAVAKLEGLSNEDTLRRIEAALTTDSPQSKRKPRQRTQERTLRVEGVKNTPYYSYSDIQHSIISVASRITRTYQEHSLFKKTGPFAINLINKYKALQGTETVTSERAFYTLSLVNLEKEKKRFSPVYSLLIELVELIFDGKTEDEAFQILTSGSKLPFLKNTKERDISKQGAVPKRAERPSSCPQGKKAIIRALQECGMPKNRIQECINLAVYLDSTLNASITLSVKDYFLTLQEIIRVRKMTSFNSKILAYILQCCERGVPDVSLRALLSSKYPSAFKEKKQSD